MKKASLLLVVLLACWFLPKPAEAQEISIQYFHESLDPYGSWIRVADYGDCWQPNVVDPDWRPYALGHWAYTDEGWLWVSDEPFGWATYHYGRWINIESRGWCWVPGYEWAPAWVSWRYGDGYCGWAPLPPPRFVGEMGPGWYNFCEARSMGEPSLRPVIINRSYNYIYINRTVVVNAYTSGGGARVYVGPPILEINRFAGPRPVPRYRIERNVTVHHHSSDAYSHQARGGTIAVYAPPVRRDSPPAAYAAPTAYVGSPVVNNGRNVYRPPSVGPNTPPSVMPPQNRAAPSSTYKHDPAPPMPTTSSVPPPRQPQRYQPSFAPSNGPAQGGNPYTGGQPHGRNDRGDDRHGGGHGGR